MNYDSTKIEYLQDLNKQKKENDWKGKKMGNMRLAKMYEELYNTTGIEHYKKTAKKVAMCALHLVFTSDDENGSNKKLYQMFTCKNKFCPICQWRKTKKIGYQVSKIIEWCDLNKKGCEYIFGTLTLKNCKAKDLNKTLDSIYKSYDRFNKDRKIKMAFKGIFRAVEITFNPKTKEYHPHIHFIAVVANKDYFKKSNKNYISQNKLCEIWQRCLRINYKPCCSLEKIKTKKYKAVCEVSKYSVKSKDIISESVLDVLDRALENRRLVSYSGWFKEAYQKLNLRKNEQDLVHIEDNEKVNVGLWLLTYKWSIGLKNYILIDKHKKI